MTDEQAIITVEPEIRLGTLAIRTPADMVERASEVATALGRVIEDRKLYSVISGKKFVTVEGWSTLGAMLGVIPREVLTVEHESGDYESTVELVRVTDGAIVGRGSAIVGQDETTWSKRPRYARRSMSITRATGKAYRLGFCWIIKLAGYEPTPAEEMQDTGPELKDNYTTDHTGNGKTTDRPATWPAQVITWAVQKWNLKSQQVAGALNKSQTVKATDPDTVLQEWLTDYRAARETMDSDGAAAVADNRRNAAIELSKAA